MLQQDPIMVLQIIELLKSGRIADNAQQQKVYQQIQEYSKQFQFYNYLAYILSLKAELDLQTRHMAVVTLKSQLEQNYDILPEQTISFINATIFQTFNDNEQSIRNSIGNLTAIIIIKGSFKKHPELLNFLVSNLNSKDATIIQNTVDCIFKIFEDLRLNSDNLNCEKELNLLIEQLFRFCNSSFNSQIQQMAMNALNQCIYLMPSSLAQNLDGYLSSLLQAANNQDCKVRLRAFQGIVALTEVKKDLVLTHFSNIMQVILQGIQDSNNEVCKNACNFLQEYMFYEDNDYQNYERRMFALQNYLVHILPHLIKGLKYTDDDLINILPSTGTDNVSKQNEMDEDFDENESQDEENEKDEFFSGEYTLRKICGRIIEKISKFFQDLAYNILQPYINECFFNADWKIQEIGIICLGTISKGSQNVIKNHLNQIFVSLIETYNKENCYYLLQSSILWTISQYTYFLVENHMQLSEVIKRYLQLLVLGISQNQPYLQECSCHCLNIFIEEGSSILQPYIFEFINVIIAALRVYNNESLNMLLVAICTLAETMENQIKKPEILGVLIPELIIKMNQKDSTDIKVKPILECLSQICQVSEILFQNYCYPVYNKCFDIIQNYLMLKDKKKESKQNHFIKQLFISAIDLLSSIVFVSKSGFMQIGHKQDILNIINLTINSEDSEIRSYIFSFLAEISKNCPDFIRENVNSYYQEIIKSVVLLEGIEFGNAYLATCNNAIMCLNEFCINYSDLMQQNSYFICKKIIYALESKNKLNKIIARNFVKSLCSIALLDIENVSQHLDVFIQKFCLSMRQCTNDDPLKERAFDGLFQMCFKRSDKIINFMEYIVDCFMNYNNPSEKSKEQFRNLINEYKKSLSDEQWTDFISNKKITQQNIQKLITTYL